MGLPFLITGAVLIAASLVVFALSARRYRLSWRGTVLLAAGLFGLVTGWLLLEPNANRGEALKTGGLAAGSVVALYALWLNDRRRRTDEARHEHDRERVSDERFARAVELLGDDADQVRVGAMHALAGLARVEDRYVQTVLEILCSYLRRPFDHLSGDEHEKVVRSTAQRLIRDLLPLASDADARPHHLDLTGAQLAYFDISERVVGTLTMRFTTLHDSNSMWGCRITGSAWFTGARSLGILHAHDTAFLGKAWFSGFIATGPVRLARSTFAGPVKTTGAEVAECDVDLHALDTVG
ncbi:hypothetical protein ACFPM7_01285 [Actinokineospora guangxiensis]|uniref:Pentapeptide repeat protein n=1 Tax=Actinokineospora guangxiensis TaxID=1490288 RepID=A0ABW0EG92_9PSEU